MKPTMFYFIAVSLAVSLAVPLARTQALTRTVRDDEVDIRHCMLARRGDSEDSKDGGFSQFGSPSAVDSQRMKKDRRNECCRARRADETFEEKMRRRERDRAYRSKPTLKREHGWHRNEGSVIGPRKVVSEKEPCETGTTRTVRTSKPLPLLRRRSLPQDGVWQDASHRTVYYHEVQPSDAHPFLQQVAPSVLQHTMGHDASSVRGATQSE